MLKENVSSPSKVALRSYPVQRCDLRAGQRPVLQQRSGDQPYAITAIRRQILFEDLVGSDEHSRRDFEAKRLSGL